MTEAQKRAKSKYEKLNRRNILIPFYLKNERDVKALSILDKVKSKQAFIKNLILNEEKDG